MPYKTNVTIPPIPVQGAPQKTKGTPPDENTGRKWWVAMNFAARLFGKNGTVNEDDDISGQTGNSAIAAHIADYVNHYAPALASANGLRWQGTSGGDIGKCKTVDDFVKAVVGKLDVAAKGTDALTRGARAALSGRAS